jgi:hypothetical protein
MSLTLIATIGAVVVCVNSVLSAIQVLFTAMSKTEPGWLQSASKFLLSVSQFLGSNPPNSTPPPSSPAS